MKSLIRRIQKLETSSRGIGAIRLRFARLRRLPESYQGERHLEIVGALPNQGNREWVEYQEVPGPKPILQPRRGIPECIDIIFVSPYQSQQG